MSKTPVAKATPATVSPEPEFEVPEGADALGGAMKTSDGIELPFPALNGQAHNGNSVLEEIGGVRYFGGWLTDKTKAEEFCAANNFALPAILKTVEKIKPKKGQPYDAYTTRVLHIAVIAKRFSWLNEDTHERSPKYFTGARRHLQVLALVGEPNVAAKKFDAVFPMVLTAKGYQAEEVYAAFDAWDKATGETRRALTASGKAPVPANLFYLTIGTSGAFFEKQVGKSQTSPLTPLKAVLPEKVDKPYLMARYVGKDNAAKMIDWMNQSQEWLSVWSKPVNEAETNGETAPSSLDQPDEANLPF